jgi:alpha-L-rhamnosidase
MKKLVLCLIVFIFVSVSSALLSYAVANEVSLIRKAQPVWTAGREKEMNLTLGFRAVFNTKTNAKTIPSTPKTATLKIAASTLYRVFLNGQFVGSGPARAAHGYFRVDKYDISQYLHVTVYFYEPQNTRKLAN